MRFVARVALATAVLLAAGAPARADTPDYEGEFFTDLTHQVPARTQVEISKLLRVGAEQSKIHPMLVVIGHLSDYPTMPQTIDSFATKLINDWNVGDVDTKKGVLALFSIGDRKFYVVRTYAVDSSVTDAISGSFKYGATASLKAGDVPKAMTRAASDMASALPRVTRGTSSSGTPTHTVTTTTHTHQASTPSYTYTRSGSSFGGGCIVMLIGLGIVVWILATLIGSLTGTSRGYGRSYGGYYGGYGPSYGSSGPGFWSGMATGGLLGYLFGNSGSSYSSGYGSNWSSGWGSSNDSSYTDTTTTETWSWGGGSSDSSSSSSGGGFDSFGGGGSDGSGSGGSW